jgi:hypothetical protein
MTTKEKFELEIDKEIKSHLKIINENIMFDFILGFISGSLLTVLIIFFMK